MDQVPTLIQGPSGSGKELVAQAIGLSRYIPFNSKTASFETDHSEEFIAVNLSALAPSLIESELFGHAKGAFSGATKHHAGYLGRSKAQTCVFLDEIGEVDLSIQVKLLRVLQMRTYQRVGETKLREFQGKLIAATNRNLLAEIRAGRFREDFYFRLCADLIHTPSLGEQLAECPDDLPMLVRLLVPEILNDDAGEADRLTQEVVAWVQKHLGPNYGWPGNFRELGQCIRNVMIRGSYVPSRWSEPLTSGTPREQLGQAVKSGAWTLEEVLSHYTSLVYADLKSYTAAGERLGVNWRTVKDKVSEDLVARYQTPP
jgi:DNA-binding NtrC family response regulator